MADDYSADTLTTASVVVGGTATGEIETAKDFDWFAVEFVAGQTYVIDLEGADSGGGTLENPALRSLYDADGNQIAGTRAGRRRHRQGRPVDLHRCRHRHALYRSSRLSESDGRLHRASDGMGGYGRRACRRYRPRRYHGP